MTITTSPPTDIETPIYVQSGQNVQSAPKFMLHAQVCVCIMRYTIYSVYCVYYISYIIYILTSILIIYQSDSM